MRLSENGSELICFPQVLWETPSQWLPRRPNNTKANGSPPETSESDFLARERREQHANKRGTNTITKTRKRNDCLTTQGMSAPHSSPHGIKERLHKTTPYIRHSSRARTSEAKTTLAYYNSSKIACTNCTTGSTTSTPSITINPRTSTLLYRMLQKQQGKTIMPPWTQHTLYTYSNSTRSSRSEA